LGRKRTDSKRSQSKREGHSCRFMGERGGDSEKLKKKNKKEEPMK